MPYGEGPPTEGDDLGEYVMVRRPTMPFNMDAEQGLLGALLLDNRQFENVADILKAEHFYVPAHGRIFEAIATIIGRGAAATPVTLKNHFAGDEDLAHLGGGGYMADLVASCVTMLAVRDYAAVIVEMSKRRDLIAMADELKSKAMMVDIDMPASLLVEEAEQDLYKLTASGTVNGGEKAFGEVIPTVLGSAQAAYRGDKRALGVSTFLTDLDKKLGGLLPGKLYILAARPSMGKTALATHIAFRAAQAMLGSNQGRGCVTAFYSLEMTAEELGHRIMCQCAGLDSDRVLKGQVTEDEFRRFVMASQELAQLPLHIDDSSALSVAQVRTRARRRKRKSGLGLIVVDYLQLLRGSGSKQARENRVNEVSEITRDLKALAKDLGVPVLALSQLHRGVEQRDDKRPMLADLRESGSIEQDADAVMFLFREEYYLEKSQPQRTPKETQEAYANRSTVWQEMMTKSAGIAEIIIAKQRGGPVGFVRAKWDGPTTAFSDLYADYRLEQ